MISSRLTDQPRMLGEDRQFIHKMLSQSRPLFKHKILFIKCHIMGSRLTESWYFATMDLFRLSKPMPLLAIYLSVNHNMGTVEVKPLMFNECINIFV